MARFAGQREIDVKFPMRAASVDPKSTQLTPLTIARKDEAEFTEGIDYFTVGPDFRASSPYYASSERWHVMHLAFRVDSQRIWRPLFC